MNDQETLEIPSLSKGKRRVFKKSRKRLKKRSQFKKNWTGYDFKQKCFKYKLTKEFDPGSGRTLAARLTHASRTELF